MPECGIFIEPKGREGKVIGGAAYPCRLPPNHDGPCWAPEVKSSHAPREAYNKSVRDLPHPGVIDLQYFQGKRHGFGWDDRFGPQEDEEGDPTIWAETENFRQGAGQSSVPGMSPKVEGESDAIRTFKESTDPAPEDPGQTGDTGEVEPQTIPVAEPQTIPVAKPPMRGVDVPTQLELKHIFLDIEQALTASGWLSDEENHDKLYLIWQLILAHPWPQGG